MTRWQQTLRIGLVIGLLAVLVIFPPQGCLRTSSSGDHISNDAFQTNVLRANGLVLVDFWATWCGPCRVMLPKLDKMEKNYAGRVKLVRIDVDANPDLAGHYEIRAIPTMILFRDGKPVDLREGAMMERELNTWIDAHLVPTQETNNARQN